MDTVAALLAGYPFDVLLGSVHWVGAWRFDDLDDPVSMAEWSVRDVDDCWDAYTRALEELAASGTCDVLAHPDLMKVAGHVPDAPAEWWDRMAEAAASSGMAAELSSSGWRKPAGEQYPAPAAARAVRGPRGAPHHGLRRPPPRPRGPPGRRPARRCWRRWASTCCRATGAATPTPWSCRGAPTPGPRRGRSPDADPRRARPEPHRPQARGARAPAATARELERAGRPLLLRPPPARAGARRGRGAATAAVRRLGAGRLGGRGGPRAGRAGQMRPNNRPTLVEQDLVGQTVNESQWTLVAQCLHSGEIVRGSIHHPILGERGPGGEHPGPLRRPDHRRPAAGLAGAAQGSDLHVRADLPRRVRAPGRHGGAVRLPLPRRGRRHRGGAAGRRRRRRGRRRRAGRVRIAQRHERVPPHGDLHPARGAALRGSRHRGVRRRVGARHGSSRGRGGRAAPRRHRARPLHPAPLPRRGDRGDDPAARRHRRAAPRPAAALQGRRHPRGAPPRQEQPADHLVAAEPPGAPGGRPGGTGGAARGRAPGALHRSGARDPLARPERPGALRRDRRLAGPDGRGLGGVVAAGRDRGARRPRRRGGRRGHAARGDGGRAAAERGRARLRSRGCGRQ